MQTFRIPGIPAEIATVHLLIALPTYSVIIKKNYPRKRLWRSAGLRDAKDPTLSRQ
jgi:hypothetical protein